MIVSLRTQRCNNAHTVYTVTMRLVQCARATVVTHTWVVCGHDLLSSGGESRGHATCTQRRLVQQSSKLEVCSAWLRLPSHGAPVRLCLLCGRLTFAPLACLSLQPQALG